MMSQVFEDVACNSRHDRKRFKGFCVSLFCVGLASTNLWAQEDSGAATGFLEIVFSGGVIGFCIILLLLGLSLTAAYLVFEQILTLRKTELLPVELETRLRDSFSQGKLKEAVEICRQEPGFLTFVVQHGLAEMESGWSSVEKALEDALSEQSARLLRKIEYLSVIGNIAPMVGLLGTVTGMVFAFQRVATTQGAAGAGELAEGIYQALVTTIGGLIVAIPSLAAFAIFRNRVDQLVAETAYSVQSIFRPIKRRILKRSPANAPTAPPTI